MQTISQTTMPQTTIPQTTIPQDTDILVIGGGINGAGIAYDAAGRGLRVVLCEQNDLASATSSASSKLIHGGLRYLEHYEFRLVREALSERRTLLDTAPHLVHPMRFVLPHHPSMRPAWMLSLGLFLYDHLSKFDPRLARSHRLNLTKDREGQALNDTTKTGFSYADCWVDDSRLVVANAQGAADRGAHILTRTQVVKAERQGAAWDVTVRREDGEPVIIRARAIVNAAGPWTVDVLETCHASKAPHGLRLIKGSHMVVPRLYDGDHAYILQNDDGRIVFVIPYHQDFTLIGTTEVMMESAPSLSGDRLDISSQETEYLCQSVNAYFNKSIAPSDVVWSFAGVRPLFDDAAAQASKVTREYVLDLDSRDGLPVLSVFGGKLTTYRRLAEKALHRLRSTFPEMGKPWTALSPLPGGDMPDHFQDHVRHMYPHIAAETLQGLANRHGERLHIVLDGAETDKDLGQDFGGGLMAREVDYMITHEWAKTAEDVLWRRSKLGLRLSAAQQKSLQNYMLSQKG